MKRHLLLNFFAANACFATTIQIQQPQDYQVFQRQAKNSATITLQGVVLDAPSSANLRAEWQFISPDGKTTSWQPVAIDPKTKQLSQQISRTAQPGWYQINVRVSDTTNPLATTQIYHVGVGEVFVVAGQSNSGNFSEEQTKTQTGCVSAFDGKTWSIANDPIPHADGPKGSFMPTFGDLLFKKFQVPIAFVPSGIGGTSIRQWLPAGTTFPLPSRDQRYIARNPDGSWQSNGQVLNALIERMKILGPNGYRAVLWHQGESDSSPEKAWYLAPKDYASMLRKVIRTAKEQSATNQPWFVSQVSYHNPQFRGSADLRAAQASLWKDQTALPGPNTDLLMEPFREQNGQGIHFSGKGQRELAKVWADCVTPWLQSQLR